MPPTGAATPTRSLESTSTLTPTAIPPETRLKIQCLDILSELPADLSSEGILVLESRVTVDHRHKPETFLMNMATGVDTQIAERGEYQSSFSISPDKKLMAYVSGFFDAEGREIKNELVIATADGGRLKSIPEEKTWVGFPGWLDNQNLAVTMAGAFPGEDGVHKPATLLALNVFTDARKILHPDYPKLLEPRSPGLPFWNMWFGIVYDGALTRAIYPRSIEGDQYTYGIWDISRRKLQATLDGIFIGPSGDSMFPMPVWSPDGSQFVLRGLIHKSGFPAGSELYRVSRDGDPEQLTHLTSVWNIQDSNLSWSPDGRYIAMFLNKGNWDEEKAHLAVLDTVTLNVTEYCVEATYAGEGYGRNGPPPAVWSPDGQKLLIVDWYEKDHQHVILVDVEKGIAARLTEDMEPVGWMNAP